MQRDTSNLIFQAFSGNLRYVFDSIEDFIENEKNIKYWGSKAQLTFEGHYFLSYDIKDSCELIYSNRELTPLHIYEFLNSSLKNFAGTTLQISINHDIINPSFSEPASSIHIFNPRFSYQKTHSNLILNNYDTIPKSKNRKNLQLSSKFSFQTN